jgi:nucleotide-binding universal stress UspA family protein
VVSPETDIEPYLDPHYAFEKLASLLPSESKNAQMKVHTLVVPGDTTKEILRAAEELHADMIVLGVHPGLPHGALRKEEHAYSVVISALCPVLSFRTPEHKGKKSSDSVHDVCVIC